MVTGEFTFNPQIAIPYSRFTIFAIYPSYTTRPSTRVNRTLPHIS